MNIAGEVRPDEPKPSKLESMMGTESFKNQNLAKPSHHGQDKRNNFFKPMQRKDPGMNAEVLNITVSETKLEESTANRFVLNESLTSPFIESNEDKKIILV